MPRRALAYKRQLIRVAQAYWGLDAPVARMAGQIHLESAWIPTAKNPVASGLGQFTARTAATMAQLYPELDPPQPFSPVWALRAVVIYDLHLYRGIQAHADTSSLPTCTLWAMILSAYNGGPGWLERDRRLAQQRGASPDRWWGAVSEHSRRSAENRRRNRAYVDAILCRFEPAYRLAGWPGGDDGCQ